MIDSGDGRRALFLADLAPTSVHVRLPYVMAYDHEPAVTFETKRRLFGSAIDENWLLIFGHDPKHHAATLRRGDDGRPRVEHYLRLD
jgi:glyoxylase-like metal-dependent hydrolase (beta-lactamase superfamily II)